MLSKPSHHCSAGFNFHSCKGSPFLAVSMQQILFSKLRHKMKFSCFCHVTFPLFLLIFFHPTDAMRLFPCLFPMGEIFVHQRMEAGVVNGLLLYC